MRYEFIFLSDSAQAVVWMVKFTDNSLTKITSRKLRECLVSQKLYIGAEVKIKFPKDGEHIGNVIYGKGKHPEVCLSIAKIQGSAASFSPKKKKKKK